MAFARRFLAFWYDFLVGDDWVLAVGTVLLLAITALLVSGPAASLGWIVLPVGAILVLLVSLWRAVRAA